MDLQITNLVIVQENAILCTISKKGHKERNENQPNT
jgi:hypothetical protein